MISERLALPELWEGILVENLPSQTGHLVKILTTSGKIRFVATAQSGEQLKSLYSSQLEGINFFLTDLDLSGPNGDERMNGITLAEEIRREPKFNKLPVIFYTSFPKIFAGTLNTLKFARDKHYGIMLREELTEERLLNWLPILFRGGYLCTPSVENYIDEESEYKNESLLQIMKDVATEERRQLDNNKKVNLRDLERVCKLNGLGLSTEQIAQDMDCSVRQLQRLFQDIFILLKLEDGVTSPQDNRRRLAIMYTAKRWLYWDDNGVPRTKDGKEYSKIDEINQFRLIQAYNRSLE